MVRQAWLGFVGVAVLLGACGKAEGGSGPIPREQLPARAADIVCDGRARCCQSSGFAFDVATCKRVFGADIAEDLDEELSRNVRYDANAAGACIDSLRANSRCGSLDGDSSACERIFVGTLPIGAECSSSNECREGSGQRVRCDSADGLGPSVCTLGESSVVRRGKPGESCLGTCYEGETCDYSIPVPAPSPEPGAAPAPQEQVACYRDDGLYCDYAVGTCQRLLEVGATCGSSESCAGKTFCAFGETSFETGTCTAPRRDGERCDGDSHCQSRNCDDYDGTSLCRPADHVTAEQCAEDFDDSDEAPSAGPEVPEPAPAMPAP